MRINHNIASMTTQNSLFTISREMDKSIQKLSTGLRINSASDDAAGLGVSENLRTQVRGMGQALKNTQDAIALLNIADGALNEQAAIMQRMRELVIQAKNDTYTQTERDYMGQEFSQLMEELDRIAATTKYNGMQLFATPEISGNNVNGIYASNSDTAAPETAHKTAQSSYLPNGGSLGDVNDGGSGHHFNMLIGQNYNSNDNASYVTTNGRNYYESTAENMLTIALGQMDSNALFHTAPSSAVVGVDIGGKGLFDGFSWDPNAANDLGDFLIDLSVGGGVPGSGTVSNKLDIILKVIDGGSDVTTAERLFVFGNPNVQSPTGLDRINKMRSNIGAMINRLEHTVNNLMNQETNTQAAESIIRDTDFAEETVNFTRNQILSQSSTAMLAQANTLPQMVTQLLQ
ncbi:MAG: flagellin [Chitinispirillaceae bacterium]|nr:flagellin [Chitinispirillaceae bacterium]